MTPELFSALFFLWVLPTLLSKLVFVLIHADFFSTAARTLHGKSYYRNMAILGFSVFCFSFLSCVFGLGLVILFVPTMSILAGFDSVWFSDPVLTVVAYIPFCTTCAGTTIYLQCVKKNWPRVVAHFAL